MSILISKILLWAFVINLGISMGAGLYESRIQSPQWLTGSEAAGYQWNRAAAVQADVGLRFWVYVSTLPLTLLTLAGLAAVWWAPHPVRAWWLAALGACLAERAMTFGYFIPTMIDLMKDGFYGDADATAKALQWVKLGYVRIGATALSFLSAMKAFSLLYLGLGK